MPPGKLGKDPGEGSPGIEPAPGRLGSDPAEISPGIELAEGRLGSEGSPDPELPVEVLGDEGAEGVEGAVGAAGTGGTGGRELAVGRLGSPGGLVTQSVTPLLLEAWSDPPPAGDATLPPPETDPGAGMAGAAGGLTH